MLRKIILSVAMLLSVGALSAQVKFEDVSTDELHDMAKAQEKLIFLDIYATWCPPCVAMNKNVFSRADVGEFMSKRFVSAKYDIDKEPGRSIANKFRINSIPTYLVFDVEGNLLGMLQGGMPAEEIMSKITENLPK